MSPVAEDYDFHGTHPATPRPDAVPVRWAMVEDRPLPARVRGYTCECLPIIFEDCRAGGQGFIRRYDRSVSPWVIAESPRIKVSAAERLWRQLINGEAR
ncbi:unnamed protein product [[Actinomadura] parvosata subsp. kistnae]|uniref:Uncharacterized protein n=2 Tax=Nonomuraea TaxID=83681 RepID=A0A1V0AEE4_9ACTN|nr:hypothetical protein BKM31_50280 [Nonomuraea sp. ATCC 55076]SPL92946.1 unnamed protein product [Actinomadura parvosata subsp. kistnae]